MGKTQRRVATAATLTAVYAAWHLTSGMHGTIVHLHTPSALAAITTSALATSQCQNLPPSTAASPSASPSPSSSTGRLCISLQAAQDSIRRGKTATWTIQVQTEGGPATAVAITLATIQSGPVPVFTGSCPSGGGRTACTVGDLGTAVAPASYQLQAQVAVPPGTGGGTLTLVASADTSPIMASIPAAGQTITITGTPASATPHPKPSPVLTTPPALVATQPVTPPAAVPTIAPVPTIAALPTAAVETTTVPPGSVTNALPQITPTASTTPVIATAPAAPLSGINSTPAADIQAVAPTTASTPAADSFTFSVGMSARTAEILSFILLGLIFTLTTARLTSRYITSRQPTPQKPEPDTSKPDSARHPRLGLPHWRRPHLPRQSRAERRATREQNWHRYLESQEATPGIVTGNSPFRITDGTGRS